MGKKECLKVNNPLIYIFVIFVIASYTYSVYSYNKLMAMIIVISFFILLTIKRKISYILIILMFFIATYMNNYWYYSYKPQKHEVIRINKLYSYFGEGEIQGRKIKLIIPNSQIIVGERIYAEGSFQSEINYSKGIIGEYKIKAYKKLSDDIFSMSYKLRKSIYERIAEKLGERKASLISSVSYGYTDNLDEDDRNEMKQLGISHIVAVSGLHLAIVYSVLKKCFKVPLALLLTFMYVIFTGGAASAVRAYIMVFVMELGLLFRKNYNSLAALSLAGILILLFKPYEIFNLGFAFSFLATLGIILFNRRINKWLYKLPDSIRGVIAVTISAQILTFPLSIIYFNEYSINSILGNLIAVPIINLLIILGLILLLGYNLSCIFDFILFLCHYIIKIEDYIITVSGNISVDILCINKYIAYFYMAMLITYYFYKKGYKKFIYYPLIVFSLVSINIYSFFPKIQYYKDQGLLISYRGQREFIVFNDDYDKKYLEKITLCNRIIDNSFNKIRIANKCYLLKKDDNYLIKTHNSEYILKVSYGKIKGQYDIIDLVKGDIEEIQIYDDSIMRK